LALAASILGAAALLHQANADDHPLSAAPFRTDMTTSFIPEVTALLAVSLFIARAVEVIVQVFRDGGADQLQNTIDFAQMVVDDLQKSQPVFHPAPAAQTLPAASEALLAAQQALQDHRNGTKEMALPISFIFGVLVWT
jgi:hypothetical protein